MAGDGAFGQLGAGTLCTHAAQPVPVQGALTSHQVGSDSRLTFGNNCEEAKLLADLCESLTVIIVHQSASACSAAEHA